MAAEDSLGRTIDLGNKKLSEIESLIKSLMQGPVGASSKPPSASAKSVDDATLQEIAKNLEMLNSNIGKEFKDAIAYLNEVINILNTKSSGGGDGKTVKAVSEKPSEALMSINHDISNLAKHALKKGSIFVHDVGTHKLLSQVLTEGFKIDASKVADVAKDYPKDESVTAKAAATAKKSTADKAGPDKAVDIAKNFSKYKEKLIDELATAYPDKTDEWLEREADEMIKTSGATTSAVSKKAISIVENASHSLQTTLFGLGEKGDLGETLFGGVIDKEVEFMRKSRAAAYEVAGITSETRSLQNSFSELEQTAYLTGFGRSEMQENYLKNIKAGIKDAKVAKAVTTAQLQVEKQLGFEAGELGENFKDLNLSGRMSVNQIADMGRGMKSVARNAGLSGEALKAAISSAKEFTDQMAKSATLTSSAATNVTQIVASSQKLGVGDSAKQFLKAATSSADLMLSASDETKNLLYNAAASVGRIGDLQKGTLLRSKAGIKDLRKGFDNILKSFGVASADAIDNLSDESKMMLNIQLKSTFGMELGEFRNQIDALKESEKGLAEKMNDINKKRKENLTLEEKAKLVEEERGLKINASLGALTALEEASKGAKDMNQALSKFGDRKSEFEADIKTLGGDFKSSAGAAKTALTSAIENVNEGLRKAGKAELEISSSEISKALKDPTALREITAKINKGNQELETAQKAQLDPMSAVEQSAKELNDMFRSYSSSAVSGISDLVGNSGMMLVALGTIATGQISSLASLSQSISPTLAQLGGYFVENMNSTEKGFGGLAKAFGKTALSGLAGMFDVAGVIQSFSEGKIAATAELAAAEEAQAAADAMEKAALGIIGSKMDDAGSKAPAEKAAEGAVKEATAPKPIAEKIGEVISPKPAEGSKSSLKDVQAALELMTEEINAIRKAVKNDMMNVEMSEKFYKFWKQETKKIVKAQLHTSKKGKNEAVVAGTEAAVAPAATEVAEAAAAAPAAEEGAAPVKAQSGLLEFLKDGSLLEKAGDALMDYGPMLALLAAGLVAVATAIIAVMNKVFSITGLDLGTAVKTAATIGIILGSVAAIFAASVAAYKALADFEPELAKLDWKKAAIVGAKLGALAIGLSALAIGIIFVIKTMSDAAGLDIGAIAELGGTIAGVVGAVVAIGKAIEEAVPALIEFAPILDKAKNSWKEMAKGALALLILGPALVLLSLAVLKIIELMGAAFGIDFNKAVEIGYLTAAILGATAAIALGVMAAMAGLWALGLLASGATLGMAGFMLLGAAALMVFAPAVVLLGLALLSFIDELAKSADIDAAKAYEVGELVTAILWSSAQIAVQTIAAMAGLFLLGTMAVAMWASIGMIMVGAAALIVFAPAVAALGMGLIALIDELASGFDITAEKAYAIGDLVSAVLWAAGSIAVQTIAAMGGLFALGTLAGFIPMAIKNIATGAAALLLFGPAVFLLGSVLLSSIGGIAEGMDITPEFVEQTGLIFTAVLDATANIVQQMVPALLGLGVLGLAAKIMLWLIPLMLFGVGAFSAGMAVFTLLALNIAMFGYNMQSAGVDLETLEIINGMVWNLEQIFQGIASSLNTFSNELMPLFDGFLWFNSVADNIVKIIPEMQKSFGSIVAFFNFGILRPLLMLPSPAALQYIMEVLEPMPSIFKSIAGVLKTLGEELVPLFTEGYIFSSIGTKIKEAIPTMRMGLLSVFEFLDKGVITPVFEKIGNPRDVKMAAEALDGLAKMIPLVPQVVKGINNELAPLLKPGLFSKVSKLERAEQTAAEMGDRFEGICKFIDKGIITPIFENIGNPRDVKMAAEALEGISKILPLVPEVVIGISKHLKPLVTPGWWSKQTKLDRVDKIIADVGTRFADIAKFVDDAIIEPIFKNIGNPRDVKIAAEALEGTGKMLPLVKDAVEGVGTHLKPLTKKKGLFGGGNNKLDNVQSLINEIGPQLANVFKFVDQGIITPIFENIGNPNDIKIAVEALTGTNKLLEIMPKEIQMLAKNLTPLSTSLMSMANIDLPEVETVVGTMEKYGATTQMVTMLPQILSEMNSGLTKITELGLTFDSEAANNNINQITNGLNDILSDSLDSQVIAELATKVGESATQMQLVDENFKQLVASLESVAASMNRVGTLQGDFANLNMGTVNATAGISSIATGGSTLANLDTTQVAKAGQSKVAVSTADTMGLTADNIQNKIEMNAATAPSPTNVTGGELGDLSETAAEGLTVNQQMRDLLSQILTNLTPKSGGGEGASATPMSTRPKSGDTFNLVTGRFAESSSVSVTNLG